MSKIVQAVNAMISNPSMISKVTPSGDASEIFFVYKGKYKWSIADRDGMFILFFYPGKESLETLAEQQDWQGTAMVRYNAEELGTREARSSFAELHRLLSEKLHGVDVVLEDIINDDDIPF